MAGSTYLRKDVPDPRWEVHWRVPGKKSPHKITRYRGDLMFQTNARNPKRDRGFQTANMILGLMRDDMNKGTFRIERFKNLGWTDVVEFYQKWLDDKAIPCLKPGSIRKYTQYLTNYVEPFFRDKEVMLHEIKADTLMEFLSFILKRKMEKAVNDVSKIDRVRDIHEENPGLNAAQVGKLLANDFGLNVTPSTVRKMWSDVKKGVDIKRVSPEERNFGGSAKRIMAAFRSMLGYAYQSEKIFSIPPLPEKQYYKINPGRFDYLTPGEFGKVLNHLRPEEAPIFLWLKLHFRRPGQACALHKADYDQINQEFDVHRSISDRVLMNSVKTSNQSGIRGHLVVCDDDYLATANRLMAQNTDSPFLFVNPRADETKNPGCRYSLETLRQAWYHGCDRAGIRRIWPYRGTKHTACMEFVENGGSEDELMMETDHANRESVKAYYRVTSRQKKQVRAAAKRRKEQATEKYQEIVTPKNVVNLFGN